LLSAALTGCATLPDGSAWGDGATPAPGWARIRRAAADAALSPRTWAPAAAALLLQVDGADARLGEWAADHTPVFGSGSAARDASGDLLVVTEWAYAVSLVATPSGTEAHPWISAKAKGLAVEATAVGATAALVETTKHAAGRLRPDGSDTRSFPSGHAALTSVQSTLAGRNLRSVPIGAGARTFLASGCAALAAGAGWARVEGRRHHPSDVLIGHALGHFLGAFLFDAFLGPGETGLLDVRLSVGGDGLGIGVGGRL
jgi:membrane-associated phospholipid phosphatase